MQLFTVNGIVLRYSDYRDSDRMLTILTRDGVKLSALSRGCRKPKSPHLSASQLFAYSEFTIFENGTKSYINSCDMLESFYAIASDIKRFNAAVNVVSLTDALVSGNAPHPAMFTLLYHTLSFIAYTDLRPLDLLLGFTVKALSDAGYSPAITRCACCGTDLRTLTQLRFSNFHGGAICEKCAGSDYNVSTLTLEAMRRIRAMDTTEMKKIALPEQVRMELMPILSGYIAYTLGKSAPGNFLFE